MITSIRSYDRFAFDNNSKLRTAGLVTAMASDSRGYLALENYMAKMRKVYFEATRGEVEWKFQSVIENSIPGNIGKAACFET